MCVRARVPYLQVVLPCEVRSAIYKEQKMVNRASLAKGMVCVCVEGGGGWVGGVGGELN